MKRRILLLLAATLIALGLSSARPAGALADGNGGDNTAIAINTKDGSTVFKVAFAIRHVMSDVVDQSNAAVAVASCTQCTTVAIAIEIVLIENNPNVVTPTNIALAINVDCTLCVTVADAEQFLLSTNGPVHFDAEGNRLMAEVRRELEQLKHEDLTLDELLARLAQIRAQVEDALANHLVAAGKPQESPPAATPTTTSTPTTTVQTTTTTETTTTEPTTTTSTTTGGVTTTSGP
jgi:putative peptide zinc metalloprotease protein